IRRDIYAEDIPVEEVAIVSPGEFADDAYHVVRGEAFASLVVFAVKLAHQIVEAVSRLRVVKYRKVEQRTQVLTLSVVGNSKGHGRVVTNPRRGRCTGRRNVGARWILLDARYRLLDAVDELVLVPKSRPVDGLRAVVVCKTLRDPQRRRFVLATV